MATNRMLLEFARAEQADDPYAFSFRSQQYLVRTERGGFRREEWAWDAEMLSDLEAVGEPDCDPVIVQRMGDRLYTFLAQAGFERHEGWILQAAERAERIYITIRSAAAELYALPWELLTLRASGQHLDELSGLLIRYAWPETQTTPVPSAPTDEGRILVAFSEAGGPLPASEHQAIIQKICKRASYSFDVKRDVLSDVSLARLDDALSSGRREGKPISALHILAHGCAHGEAFGLSWNSEPSDVGGKGSVVVDPGRLRQILAPYADQLRLVVLCACDSGNSGALGNHLGSFAQTLHRAGIQSVVASRAPLSVRGSIRLTETLYDRLVGEPASLESAITSARKALAHDADSLDWANLQLYARPEDGDDTRPLIIRPYRGLLPFRAEHARFFFGREAEVGEILSNLQTLVEADKPRFLVVAGASGTGKSSVVMGGALAALMENSAESTDDGVEVESALRTIELWQQRNGSHNLRRAIDELRRGVVERRALSNSAWEIAVMRVGNQPMQTLEATMAARRDPSCDFLLVVDQFEELFTAIDSPDLRQRFAQKLWMLSHGPSRVHCIITIRVDFLGKCGDIVLDGSDLRLDQVAYDERHRVFVAHTRSEQQRAAIEGPARLVGLQFEPGLTATILDEVGAEPGALPLL